MTFKITTPIIEPTEGSPHATTSVSNTPDLLSFVILHLNALRQFFTQDNARYRSYLSFSY